MLWRIVSLWKNFINLAMAMIVPAFIIYAMVLLFTLPKIEGPSAIAVIDEAKLSEAAAPIKTTIRFSNQEQDTPLSFWQSLINKVETIGLALVGTGDGVFNSSSLLGDSVEPSYRRLATGVTSKLTKLFSNEGYDLKDIRSGDKEVPRVAVSALPSDLHQLSDSDERKDIFLKALLPLVLLANEEIAQERAMIQNLSSPSHKITSSELDLLNMLYKKWNMDNEKDHSFGELLERVDNIPPSIVLAQAAIESGWGSSRFAREGHALFGQWTYEDKKVKALNPSEREEGATNQIRAFSEPMAAVRSYMRNLNSYPAYKEFRMARAALRKQGKPITAKPLLAYLDSYSEQGEEYTQLIESVISHNDLLDFDGAKLAALPSKAAEVRYSSISELGPILTINWK